MCCAAMGSASVRFPPHEIERSIRDPMLWFAARYVVDLARPRLRVRAIVMVRFKRAKRVRSLGLVEGTPCALLR